MKNQRKFSKEAEEETVKLNKEKTHQLEKEKINIFELNLNFLIC
jgi:hypothetical protein